MKTDSKEQTEGEGGPLSRALGLQSRDAFERALPELLKTHAGKWVGFHGAELVAITDTENEAIAACEARGIGEDDYYVDGVFVDVLRAKAVIEMEDPFFWDS